MDRVERVARAAFAESVRVVARMRPIPGETRVNEIMDSARDHVSDDGVEELWGGVDEQIREYWRRVALVAIKEATGH